MQLNFLPNVPDQVQQALQAFVDYAKPFNDNGTLIRNTDKIKEFYRTAALQWHPDRTPPEGVSKQTQEAVFKTIAYGHELLTYDPKGSSEKIQRRLGYARGNYIDWPIIPEEATSPAAAPQEETAQAPQEDIVDPNPPANLWGFNVREGEAPHIMRGVVILVYSVRYKEGNPPRAGRPDERPVRSMTSVALYVRGARKEVSVFREINFRDEREYEDTVQAHVFTLSYGFAEKNRRIETQETPLYVIEMDAGGTSRVLLSTTVQQIRNTAFGEMEPVPPVSADRDPPDRIQEDLQALIRKVPNLFGASDQGILIFETRDLGEAWPSRVYAGQIHIPPQNRPKAVDGVVREFIAHALVFRTLGDAVREVAAQLGTRGLNFDKVPTVSVANFTIRRLGSAAHQPRPS
jgi:hypothetical protein